MNDEDSLRGRRAQAAIELGKVIEAVSDLKPMMLEVHQVASVSPQCRGPAPNCVPAQQPDALSRETCTQALAEWQDRCRAPGAASSLQPPPRLAKVYRALSAEQEAIAATLRTADETIRRVESAPRRLLAQSASIQASVAKEAQKTSPDLNAVAAVVALVKREGTPSAPASSGSPSPGAAQSKAAKPYALDGDAKATVAAAEALVERARDARLRLAVLLDDIAARTSGAEEGLAQCSVSVPGVTLDVVPGDTALSVKAGGKLMFDVGGGSGVPTASAMFGSVSGRLVEGQLRFEYQAPAQVPDGPDIITFRDGARQARHVVKVTVQ